MLIPNPKRKKYLTLRAAPKYCSYLLCYFEHYFQSSDNHVLERELNIKDTANLILERHRYDLV